MNTRIFTQLALVAGLGLSGTAYADGAICGNCLPGDPPVPSTLQGRDLDGNLATIEAYYDTALNITWLADANYAGSQGLNPHGSGLGQLNWAEANTWAANLSIVDAVHNITYDNWRLPTTGTATAPYCLGYNCGNSELGYLFYGELGGVPRTSLSATHNANYDLFNNITDRPFWSSTEYDSQYAWDFRFDHGFQSTTYKGAVKYAWAVSHGNVGIATVPEADTWAMLLAGLGLVGVAVRRRYMTKSE